MTHIKLITSVLSALADFGAGFKSLGEYHGGNARSDWAIWA
jgi:hypothetical protein